MSMHATLRSLRTEIGMTLVELSDRTGLSVSYLSDIERGKAAALDSALATVNKILAVYGKETRIDIVARPVRRASPGDEIAYRYGDAWVDAIYVEPRDGDTSLIIAEPSGIPPFTTHAEYGHEPSMWRFVDEVRP